MRETIRTLIEKTVLELGCEGVFEKLDHVDFSVSPPERVEQGDWATNVAFALAKRVGQKPMDIAAALAAKLKTMGENIFADVIPAKPGFINFILSDRALSESLGAVLKSSDEWGENDRGKGKTVIVEYFQLNIAKRPHVGHVRSAIIGDALKRIFLASGYATVSDTHVGDWGTQFGILLLAYKEAGKQEIEGDPFDALEKLYIAENERIANDPARREQAKEEFAKLEWGDEENRKIWQWMVDVSMKKLEEGAARLGLLPFDEHMGESAYERAMPPIVERALKESVAKKTEDGAVVVDISADGLDEAVLVKSDGASTYLLRDLATIQYRKQKWNFWKNLYVVDARQSHHFRQVFRVAELLGFEGSEESEHIDYGFLSLPEGPMSTRTGTVISLDAVLDEAAKKALGIIREKNSGLENAGAVARAVGLGALKYFNLSRHRKTDIVFTWEDALSFDGDTGPYLQYTHARLKSILRKAVGETKAAKEARFDEIEHRLAVATFRFPEVIEDALAGYAPNVVANYLHSLASLANEFYHSHPVTQEPDTAKRALRLALVSTVALTLAKGLELLGIAAPEEM